jgi:hypothetical protein
MGIEKLSYNEPTCGELVGRKSRTTAVNCQVNQESTCRKFRQVVNKIVNYAEKRHFIIRI